MFDFEKRFDEIGRQTVLCIGDLMLDDFVYGDVSRISPEAPAPVIRVSREDVMVGGAGNVARNIASLGADALFVGVIGDDVAGKSLQKVLAHKGSGDQGAARGRHVAADHAQAPLRVGASFDASAARRLGRGVAGSTPKTEAALIRHALALLPRAGAVVLSDYAKGVLTPKLIRAVIERAKKLGKPVIVDPKGIDYSIYRGATIITPNRKELAEATHRPVGTRRRGRGGGARR